MLMWFFCEKTWKYLPLFVVMCIYNNSELPTLTVSPCDTRFCMFSHALTPHIQFLTAKKKSDFGPRRVRYFSNSPRVAGAKERICNPIRCIDILFTPRSPEVSDRRRVTKRDKRGRNSGREYIAEENLHLQTEQRLGMLMTCGSIKYSLS